MDFDSVSAMYTKPKNITREYNSRRDVVVEQKNIDKVVNTIKAAGSITRKELIATAGLNKTTIDRVVKILDDTRVVFSTLVRVSKCQHKLINYRED